MARSLRVLFSEGSELLTVCISIREDLAPRRYALQDWRIGASWERLRRPARPDAQRLDSALEGRPNPSPPLLLIRTDVLSACVQFAVLFSTLVRSVSLTLDWRDVTARKK